MEEVNTDDDSSTGLLGLGISQQEVEVLFTEETTADINRCSEDIEPFLNALDIRDQLTMFASVAEPAQNDARTYLHQCRRSWVS